MAHFSTMTPKGMHGSSYEADTVEDAIAQATKHGYEVLDVQTDMSGDYILVIPDDDYELEGDDARTSCPRCYGPLPRGAWQCLLCGVDVSDL